MTAVITPAELLERHARVVSEEELFENVRQALDLYGWRWFHTHDSRHSNEGFLDICAIRPPRLLFVELKREGGRLTKAQQGWLEDLWNLPDGGRGGDRLPEAYIWYPSHWISGEILRLLE